MLSFLAGKIILKTEKFVVLKINGIGFKVFLSTKNLKKIKNGQDLELFTFLDVKENSLNLYGFLNEKEMEFFEILKTVRGIGPKAALEISSLGPLEEIKEKILANDETIFEGISGIGKKKAMTIILELSGKIKQTTNFAKTSTDKDEAEQALINLGFSQKKVKEALSQVPKDIKKEPEQRIKQALKFLAK